MPAPSISSTITTISTITSTGGLLAFEPARLVLFLALVVDDEVANLVPGAVGIQSVYVYVTAGLEDGDIEEEPGIGAVEV